MELRYCTTRACARPRRSSPPLCRISSGGPATLAARERMPSSCLGAFPSSSRREMSHAATAKTCTGCSRAEHAWYDADADADDATQVLFSLVEKEK